jgi:hypothetical protein
MKNAPATPTKLAKFIVDIAATGEVEDIEPAASGQHPREGNERADPCHQLQRSEKVRKLPNDFGAASLR